MSHGILLSRRRLDCCLCRVSSDNIKRTALTVHTVPCEVRTESLYIIYINSGL